ncbi:hypothetical protein AB0N31_04910 [Streptomyces sp. NPDC051051]|uniref:hypothetical protein n=1 Tax=Streptomyces sp. NPDC051051 TaxID=3155666 RepID=UPI0034437854
MHVPRNLQRDHGCRQFVSLTLKGCTISRGILARFCPPGAPIVLLCADEHQRDGTGGSGRRVEEFAVHVDHDSAAIRGVPTESVLSACD